MSKNFLDPICKKCEHYNPEAEPLYCNLTLDPTVTSLRCNILKQFEKTYKFMEKIT